MATIYATLLTPKSLVYPETTLCRGSQGFPNPENPTLQCNMTLNITKGIYCIALKFFALSAVILSIKANTKPN